MRTIRASVLAILAAAAVAVPAMAAQAGALPGPMPWATQAAQANGDPMPMSDSDRAAIRSVIERQLQAFLRDDGSAAFSFASPNIQSMFQTPDNFMSMVRQGYQPVYRPQAVSFKDIISFNGAPAQRVVVVGPDGVPVIAVYPMRQMPDGHWVIDGCYLLQFQRDDV